MTGSLSCTSNPQSRLMTLNGTYWTPSLRTKLWPFDKFYTHNSLSKLAITLRYESKNQVILITVVNFYLNL